MDYPIWNVPFFGGGVLIAWIAVIHVYVAHFAVGGGLFLPLTELKGHRENSPEILAYVKRHTLFFLLLTMVFGSLTGVAIWFIIALTSPTATLTLIRAFTFGWSTEWVFFLGEIVALLVYYYTFGKMRRREHLTVGWIYFAFGFLSLFIINGIIGAMLLPGRWLETQSFWDGFFNPAFWPQLAFRSMMCFSIAGLFGFFTATRMADPKVRDSLMRYTAKWTCIPLVLMVPAGWWCYAVLPEGRQVMVAGWNPELVTYVRALFISGPAIMALALVMAAPRADAVRKPVAVVLLALGLVYIGGFEYTREAARRPYVITGHIYSNQARVADADAINEAGWLASTAWTRHKTITDANVLEAGRELFMGQCQACHSIGGPANDIVPLTAKYGVFGMDAQLDGQGMIRDYMPPFLGTRQEREALAQFLVVGLHGADKPAYEAAFAAPGGEVAIPAFDKDADEYVLLAWNTLGMHCLSDSEPYWVLLPPANDLRCQLVRRGGSPELVTEDVVVTYTVEPGFETPSAHVRFWEVEDRLFGKELSDDTGLTGKGLSGTMDLRAGERLFEATAIPVVPYPDGGGFNPYPVFTIEARDAQSGELLASTRVVAPTSTEMGCKNCHGGTWRVDGVAGFTAATSADVLTVHDRINNTDLLRRARSGNAVLCQDCHPDAALNAPGRPDMPTLSAAIHGWHANYLTDRGEEACAACHPNNPEGPTRCLRDHHDSLGMTCLNCHGTMEEHARGLVRGQQALGVPGMDKLLAKLPLRNAESAEQVPPRQAWINSPDCLNCHRDFAPPEVFETFGQWTVGPGELFRVRGDQMDALRCPACHGAPHSTYPAREDSGYGVHRDSIQPMQYMGANAQLGKDGNCGLCHLDTAYTPEDSAHHPMGLR